MEEVPGAVWQAGGAGGAVTAGRATFSTPWKKVFHSVEKICGNFPRCGKTGAEFSMEWKKVFHGMEKRSERGLAGGAGLGLNDGEEA